MEGTLLQEPVRQWHTTLTGQFEWNIPDFYSFISCQNNVQQFITHWGRILQLWKVTAVTIHGCLKRILDTVFWDGASVFPMKIPQRANIIQINKDWRHVPTSCHYKEKKLNYHWCRCCNLELVTSFGDRSSWRESLCFWAGRDETSKRRLLATGMKKIQVWFFEIFVEPKE